MPWIYIIIDSICGEMVPEIWQLRYMNTSVAITAIVSALVAWAFMYLDSRLFDTPKSKFTYFKGMAFSAALGATIVYFMGSPRISASQLGGGAAAAAGVAAPMGAMTHVPASHVANGTAVVQGPGIREEIFSGLPPF